MIKKNWKELQFDRYVLSYFNVNILTEMKLYRPDQHWLEIEEAQNNKTIKYLNKLIGFESIDISKTHYMYYRSHIWSTP